MYDLSVLITARNEEFLARTVDGIMKNKRGKTEVIVILDGTWADPALEDHEDLTIVYHPVSVGQRVAINEAARLSKAKFIMKLDAHCIVDEGFDVKLMADCEYDWTVIPRMYNLHAFDWVCINCGFRHYQGPKIDCEKCHSEMKREIVWQPRWHKQSDFMRFDQDLHFQYWGDFKNRPEAQGDIADTMSNLGACFFMHRQRYWDMGGLDEEHGSWGQFGTEISCKTWLSGGRQVVNKKTWYSHLFRTQPGFNFPYPQSQKQIEHAREHSKDMWRNNKWPKAVHTLDWLIQKFAPVPGWEMPSNKGIIFYTDNQLNLKIARAVQGRLKSTGLPIVSASLKPMNFGKNIVVKGERGALTMFKQILATLEASTAEIIFFCEHDVLYHPSHFDFTPSRKDVYYYNENVWKVRLDDGHAVHYDCRQVSGLCAYRELLIAHYRERVRLVEEKVAEFSRDYLAGDRHDDAETDRDLDRYIRAMGYEPGTHNRKERVDDYKSEAWKSPYPIVDIRHTSNLTRSRWSQDEFRNKRNCEGWIESDEIPGWGKAIEILK